MSFKARFKFKAETTSLQYKCLTNKTSFNFIFSVHRGKHDINVLCYIVHTHSERCKLSMLITANNFKNIFFTNLFPAASALKICKRNDPNLDNCIKESIQSFLPSLRKKSENIELPPIDPFFYETVTFSYRNSNLITGSFNVNDVKTYGMSRAKILKVKSDFPNDEMIIHADLIFPKLFSTGLYTSNMTVSAFQLNSKGQYNVTMKNVKVKWIIRGKLENVGGEDYMKIYKFDVTPEAEDMKLSVSGLFADENLSMLETS